MGKVKDLAKKMNPDFGLLSGEDPQEALDPLDLFGAKKSRLAAEEAEKLGNEALTLQERQMGSLEDWMQFLKDSYSPYGTQAAPAMEGMAALSGAAGPEAELAAIEQVKSGPLYQQLLETGEGEVLRNRSVTGGLRGGGSISDINRNAQASLNTALGSRFNQLGALSGQALGGLGALTGAGSANMGQQSAMTNAMGETLGGIGNIGLSKAAADSQRMGNAIGSIGSLFAMFSDERLKTNINKIGEKNGMPWYEWEWNKTANDKFDLSGKSQGHMVSDVEINHPEAVSMQDGYKQVNYSILGGE
mgnify:CR=1 FL=1|tara:strand:+ start:817 stop:1725 length:909 start_codon:yes stop_codon:yes gene_type:complete